MQNDLKYHMEKYRASWKLLRQKLIKYDEIDEITDFFKHNKVTIIKLNSQIDKNAMANETQYSGYMTIS